LTLLATLISLSTRTLDLVFGTKRRTGGKRIVGKTALDHFGPRAGIGRKFIGYVAEPGRMQLPTKQPDEKSPKL
jgi:hypothetical protein